MLHKRWIPGLAALAAAMFLMAGAAMARPLSVEVWTDRGDDAVYSPGEQMLVKARTNDDAYLLVYEIDAQGQVTVLYPFRRSSGMVSGRNTVHLPPDDSGYELAVDNVTGQGFIVAIASRAPFLDLPWYLRPFDPQAESMGYVNRQDSDTEGVDEDGRIVGDPYVAIERIRRDVLGHPDDLADFATSYTTYFVGHEVRYPRYICYDCHRPGQWAWWDGFDPYYSQCSVIDFRVNWNWCWGPCLWSAHTPYYYYVVRPDCPPRFRRYYTNHDRWSSWDGRRRWLDLWGGPLTRYKSAPPVGYIAPPVKPNEQPRTKPPGYINTGTRGGTVWRRTPFGRNGPDAGREGGTQGRGTVWRNPSGDTQGKPGASPGGKASGNSGEGVRGSDRPRFEPPRQTPPRGKGDTPAPRQEQPRQEQPRQEPPRYTPPREQPRQNPPAYNPPRQEPRREPPKQEPRRDPPKQDQPRQDQPKKDGGSSGGGQKHRGGGGR